MDGWRSIGREQEKNKTFITLDASNDRNRNIRIDGEQKSEKRNTHCQFRILNYPNPA